MQLPGWSFIVVGVGMALMSLKLTLDGHKMGIFLLVGVGMALFGIIRTFQERKAPSGKTRGDHEPTVNHHHHRAAHGSAHGGHAHHANEHHQHHAHKPVQAHQIPRICSGCGAKNNPRANYCGHCGEKIR